LWGFAHGLLDVLNKHFQNILHISKAQSGFVQFSLYIGYLIMAVPAGLIMYYIIINGIAGTIL
jgi:FHS family L-fucose permease-like MFS transporter